jgi:hypothetical protein
MTRITGTGPADMKALAIAIRTADKTLKAELRKNMRDAAGPVVRAVQRSILDMPSHHDGTLRREVAATVTSRISFLASGVQLNILSYGQRMPEGKTNLNAAMDRAGGWGHPVFARRSQSRAQRTWTHQAGKPGWFEDPVTAKAPELRAAAQAAMDATKRKLGGL